MIPAITNQKVGLLVWSPLAGGFLSGKFTRDSVDEGARRAKFDFPPVDKEKGYAIVDVLKGIATERGVSIPQIALAWVLAQPAVTSVIIGAKSLDQLNDNLKAVDVTLSADDLKRLDEVSRLKPEYPGWMLGMPTDRTPGKDRRY